MVDTHLGFKDHIWSNLENRIRELPSLSIFKTDIRRVDLASLVEDSGNCCNLCSTVVIIYNYLHCKYFLNFKCF